MNLAYHYPIVYWNTACLIVNAGADEEIEENKSTDYGKIATAISNMQHQGINVDLPLINKADFGFVPDEPNNRIIYSLKAINGIGDDIVKEILDARPFSSMDDFYSKMVETGIITVSKMIPLIKAGCFTELDNPDRRVTMEYYLKRYVIKPVTKLTLAQFSKLMQFNELYHIIPKELDLPVRHKYFKDYVLNDVFLYKKYIDPESKRKLPKCGYHDRWFKLDDSAMIFFKDYYNDSIIEEISDGRYVISEKKFIKANEKFLKPLKEWFESEDAIEAYNRCLLREVWNKYASGSISKWEMDSLSYYKDPHELIGLQNEVYGVVDFFKLPEQPQIDSFYTRNIKQEVDGKSVWIQKEFPKYKIVRLAGTVIDRNKDRHMVSLLTTTGVVTLKFNKGQFLHYDKQISTINPDGSKTTEEKSWFTRGNKILVSGYRSENLFRVYKYADSLYKHTCNLITEIYENGTVSVATERVNTNE